MWRQLEVKVLDGRVSYGPDVGNSRKSHDSQPLGHTIQHAPVLAVAHAHPRHPPLAERLRVRPPRYTIVDLLARVPGDAGSTSSDAQLAAHRHGLAVPLFAEHE
jgi:hypothetical protein